MRLAQIKLVMARQFRDLLRDKRTAALVLLFPAIVVAITVSAGDQLRDSIADQADVRYEVFVSGLDRAPDLTGALVGNRISPRPVSDVEAAVRNESGAVGLVIPEGFDQRDEAEIQFVQVVTKSRGLRVQLKTAALGAAISAYNHQIVKERLKAAGLPAATARPVQIESLDLASSEERQGSELADLIPFLVMAQIMSMMGGLVVEMTAGEKEKRIAEATLATPLRRREIIAAKWLVASLSGFAIGTLTIGTALIAFRLVAGPDGLTLPSGALVRTLMGVMVLAVSVAAIQLTLGMVAKSSQQANIMMTPLLLLVVMPIALFQTTADLGASLAPYAVPLFGPMFLMRSGLAGNAPSLAPVLVGLVGIATTVLMLALADRVFRSERAITRVTG